MAAKSHPSTPQISSADLLLSSRISLPSDPRVLYSLFVPNSDLTVKPYEAIELARRNILLKNASSGLLESLLPSIRIGTASFMYVFLVSAQDCVESAMSDFASLKFDGLTSTQTSSFKLQGLYPCSSRCSLLLEPCTACIDRPAPTVTSPSSLFPRKPIQIVYSHFLEAIRIRLLNDISEASTDNGAQRQALRLKGGFLLNSPPSTNEWGSHWEYRALSRPLLYCKLQVHLSYHSKDSNPSLVIHPLLLSTHFLPLACSLPLPPGTPITLLPLGTPAFFLTQYSGSGSALTKQFKESLQGMGVSSWHTSHYSAGVLSNDPVSKPEFVIAWINIENKQGEDKGMIVVYPIALCLSFIPSSPSIPFRLPLDFIPELPPQLQPSPPAVLSVPVQSSACTPSDLDTSSHSLLSMTLPSFTQPSFPSVSYSHLIPPCSPTTASIRAFRTLALSKPKDIRGVAVEIGGYIDAIARERERERERLKRERETGASTSPKLSRTTATTPAAPTPATTVATDPSTPLLTTPGVSSQSVVGPSQQHHPTPTQNFYPSPPQTNLPTVPHGAHTSPTIEASSIAPTVVSISAPPPTSPITVPPPSSPAPPPPTNTTFDPFGPADPTWSIQSQPYLGMNMDMDMDMDFDMGMDMNMGMNFGMNSGSRSAGYDGGDPGMDFDDTAFTDDDFNFFDRPSTRGLPASLPAPTAVPCPPNSVNNVARGASGLDSAPAPTSIPRGASMDTPLPLFSEEVHLPGPDPLQQPFTPQSYAPSSSPWASSTVGEGFTRRHADTSTIDGNSVPPDLLPPSPGQTPSSHSAPTTPSVHLECNPAIRQSSWSSGTSIFDPIPFAAFHRELDGKYAVGKFSLPSPPDEEDRTQPLNTNRHLEPSPFPKPLVAVEPKFDKGWRFKYMAATDPRVGVMRKLIGVKRKSTFEQGGRETGGAFVVGRMTKQSPWDYEHQDWEIYKATEIQIAGEYAGDTNDGNSSISDLESDDEVDDIYEASESPVISRPSTPPPSYLPLGPTLLHTQFQHSELLPLSTSLRPPGAAVAPTSMITGNPITSVPTPVSPAAALGATSEKSKSLEAAAFTVATEVVENPPWAEAWRASNMAGSKQLPEVRPADVRATVQLLSAIPGLEGPLSISTLFGCAMPNLTKAANDAGRDLQMLEAPMISVGKGDTIIQILPTAFRFWEKLGLGPRGGKKNGISFVLFEDDGEQRQQQVESWLATVAAAYESKHLGTLTPGKNNGCPKDGLFPLRFDSSFRKTLAPFIASLPATQSSLVFFVVTPNSAISLASPVLRQVFSAIKKAAKTYSEAQIHFQLVPEQLIQGSLSNPATDFSNLEILCVSIYNRILIPVDRTVSRRFFEHGHRVRKYFQEPALTLARPIYNKVSFLHAAYAPLDVMDRNTFLHVGYQVSLCGKWILAACIDQRGEVHDLGVWLTQTTGEADLDISAEMFLVRKVWEFATAFAKKGNMEWRMVFAKLGSMGENELNAWTSFLDVTLVNHRELPAVRVTLLSVEPDAPWTFCSSRSQAKTPTKPQHSSRGSSISKGHPQSVFTDITTTVYLLSPYTHLPQSLPPSNTELGLLSSFIPEPPSTPPPDTTIDQSQHESPLSPLPFSSTTLICLPTSPSPTAITMLHIHLLHNAHHSSFSTFHPSDIATLHVDITRNFHDLAVLTGLRWRLNVNPLLPFHLAAVEAMRVALDYDQYSTDPADA